MSQMLAGHFDGKVIIPEEPVTLPVGQRLRISVELDQLTRLALFVPLVDPFRRYFRSGTRRVRHPVWHGCVTLGLAGGCGGRVASRP